MNRLHVLLALLLLPLCGWAQNRLIKGSLYDNDQQAPVAYAVVQLLQADSAYVSGTTSDEQGRYSIKAPRDGKYIVKASYVGYKTLYKNVNVVNAADVSVGQMTFRNDSHQLKEVTVTASAPKVVLKNDTFQYNASSYRVPEGSTIEALVKVLPGAEVSSDGSIKINGKEVKKILVDGKEFMTGDTKTALKNLPTSIIEKVKAYDKKSDLARITGIDDGEEETVLDFGVKKGMNKGLFSNIDLGIGTHDRYSERGMVAYFNDKLRTMGFASANNVNDMGFGGGPRGGFGPTREGLNATKMVGLNLNYNNGTTFQWDGSVRWNHSNGDTHAIVSSENFVASTSSFANRVQQEYSRSNSWDARFRLEWTPDSMWNIMFRPNMQLSKSDGLNATTSATFNADPYQYGEDPLDEASLIAANNHQALVNKQQNSTITYGDKTAVGGMLQVNRKLSDNGRNVTMRVDANYNDSDSKTFSTQDLEYFQLKNALGQDSVYHAYRYNLMPTKSWNYALRATYSEPIARKTYLQFSYQYKYGFSKSDRDTYDFSNLGSGIFSDITPAYRSWDNYLAKLTQPLSQYLDNGLSRYSEYRTYTHEVETSIRMTYEKWRLNAGVMIQPQRSSYMQDYLGVHVDTIRTVVNWSPTFDLRYRFSPQSNLRINYRGTATQPSMSQLLDIVDNTDPQNISVGNPGLKPSFTNNLRLFYNNYRQKYQQAIMTFLHFSTVRNAIGNSVTYDATTGARTVKPVNINGNWDSRLGVMFNTSIDTAGVWNVNTFTTGSFNRYASLLQQDAMSEVAKNITRNLTVGERLSASYRNSWLEVALDGSLDYTHTKNNLQQASNLSTWEFAYGGSINLTAPWNMSISTELHQNSRRGYSDASLNTNELIWNAQISQSFLKGSPLTLSLQLYDILHQQSNISRVINSTSRTDTEYNSINSYGMLKVTYRLNLFGGKPQRREGDRDHDGPMGPPPGGHGMGRPMGPPPGGGHRF